MSGEDVETLGTAVARHATAHPDQIAIRVSDGYLCYGELDAVASRVARSLHREGITAGDTVAALASASLPYLALMVGAARANVVLAPLPASAGTEAIAAMLADSGARLLFADEAFAISAGSGVPVVDLRPTSWERWLAREMTALAQAPAAAGEPTTIIYSSGTTGTPKGIVQPHAYRSAMMKGAEARGYGPDAVTLLATPLYSNTTLASLLQTLGAGGTAVLMPKFEAGQWLKLAQELHVTHAMLVPVMYQRLLAHPDFARTDLSSFRMKFCTSAPFAAALKREVLDRWPGGLTELYGMTEGGATFVLRAHEHPDKLHTVGQAVPGSEVRILDADDRDVPPGGQGEIVGRSTGMMIGYHNRPDATAEGRWVAPDGTVWQRTGDIGSLDADGFLTILDRKKDMIISGGFNIYPSDIEALLAQNVAIEEASVVGVPSMAWGETPVVFAVAPGEEPDAIRLWLNARLGRMQRVADVVLVDSLPRGSIGKVLKRELRDRYVAKCGMAD